MSLAKRIIVCLDVKDGKVVKGVQFKQHEVVGDIIALASYYSQAGADELVFYDITASSDSRTVDRQWITRIARHINIPFCVAGGIRDIASARAILNAGADKVSINSPALEKPDLISQLAEQFGQQCVVLGIDSFAQNHDYWVYQYTGDPDKMQITEKRTIDWVQTVTKLGAGEIVLNAINQDGVRQGYDIAQLQTMRALTHLPLIASGGAGNIKHFVDVFQQTNVDGALAASVFHKGIIEIAALKNTLRQQNITMRV